VTRRIPQSPAPSSLDRRTALLAIPAASLSLGSSLTGCRTGDSPANQGASSRPRASLPSSAVLEVFALGAPPWPTFDPFLFCVHHDDAYPPGNPSLGPAASLTGRNLGSDFAGKDGWRMYHGDVVPGFPRHPHRGFETVTVTRRGFIDHSDSLGATARYGGGDVQWMTAGKGIVHAEMFPLLDAKHSNPTELLQIWINLPRKHKFADPYFSMFWSSRIPERVLEDASGGKTKVRVVAGRFGPSHALAPPPDSWAANDEAEVAIWTLEMTAGARLTLPKVSAAVDRTLYFYRGQSLEVDARSLPAHVGVRIEPGAEVSLRNGSKPSELLLLQGRPIGEPIVKQGPFVMNSAEEIRQAYQDYRRSQFGGWPWAGNEPVHAPDKGRFAVHADGRLERAPS
jgi:quercetin 2,3-dioxygenase